MATVVVNQVRKFYGSAEVLHGIDIEIADGEFVVLVGPSGCGKSTLLRMIAGLEEISDGEISIDGTIVNDLPPKKRDLAMVFQSYALYPHMTVAENMGFSLKLAKVAKPQMEKQVRQAAAILDMTDYLDRYPRHLSGGQRQRVAMGRAIVRDPKVFLFDEPLSNLDAKLRGQMRAEIKSLHQKLRATTIYVTHDQTEAMTMADRIVVMRDGHVEQIGSPMEVYGNPHNSFVAGFIGSPPMNFLQGKLSTRSAKQSIDFLDGQSIELPGHVDGANGRPIQLGVRPKHLAVADGRQPLTHDFIVDLVEPTGDEMELKGKIFGQAATVVTTQTRIATGDILPLMLNGRSMYVFDTDSGERLRPV